MAANLESCKFSLISGKMMLDKASQYGRSSEKMEALARVGNAYISLAAIELQIAIVEEAERQSEKIEKKLGNK